MIKEEITFKLLMMMMMMTMMMMEMWSLNGLTETKSI
jgi:hypothetical protein